MHAVHGDDMYLKLPDVNGRGDKVENIDGGVKGSGVLWKRLMGQLKL